MKTNLIAGVDYPRDEEELALMVLSPKRPLVDESTCLTFLRHIRQWPKGAGCCKCGDILDETLTSRGRAKCRNPMCEQEQTITTDTLLHASKLKLFDWAFAAWFLAAEEMPEDSRSIANRLWTSVSPKASKVMIQKFRQAMALANSRLAWTDPIDAWAEASLSNAGPALIHFRIEEQDGDRQQIGAEVALGSGGKAKRMVSLLDEKLLQSWDMRLKAQQTPPATVDELRWILEEFVFLENRRFGKWNQGIVFRELLDLLLTPLHREERIRLGLVD